jgi:hypothetical protein
MSAWDTVSSLATGGGTLVLAVATFASVRSANRSARTAELALQEQRRPVLVHSRLGDPEQKIMFVDGHWVRLAGNHAVAEHAGGTVYLAMSLRNVGSGMAVMQAWAARPHLLTTQVDHAADGELRTQTRDLYVPGGDIGVWQGALRDPTDPRHREIAAAIDQREPFTLELLYSDNEGGQRTLSRFTVAPAGDEDWLIGAGRHWYLDRRNPR